MKDLTKGVPFKQLLLFSLPMLLSMVFQQMYNLADSVIAGRFAGENALVAVGISSPITVLFLAVATGASVGCSVVISQLYGAGDYGKMKTAVFTAVFSLGALSLLLTGVGTLICNPLMRLMNTPETVFEDAALYLRVYIFGLFFLFMYNTATAIFNGLGDSRTPLIFLIFSSVLNILLDLYFVISLRMGVGGVAWATFIAQGISSLLALSWLISRVRRIQTEDGYEKYNLRVLGNMSRIAIPSILQQSFISVGQLFVQGLVNTFDNATIGGYAAAFRINTFSITLILTMSNAVSSYTAQNLGAGRPDRVKQGYRAAMGMTVCVAGLLIGGVVAFATPLLELFLDENRNPLILAAGRQFLFTAVPFHALVAVKTVNDGILRGAGNMRAFMISTFSDLILRVALSYVLVPFMGFGGICWSYPIGWIVGAAVALAFYLTSRRKLHGLRILEYSDKVRIQ